MLKQHFHHHPLHHHHLLHLLSDEARSSALPMVKEGLNLCLSSICLFLCLGLGLSLILSLSLSLSSTYGQPSMSNGQERITCSENHEPGTPWRHLKILQQLALPEC